MIFTLHRCTMENLWGKTWRDRFLIALAFVMAEGANGGTEGEAQKWLEDMEKPFNDICHQALLKTWEVGINITPENQKASEEMTNKFAKYNSGLQEAVLKNFPSWKEFKNKRLRRAMKILATAGTANMSTERVERMNKMQAEMQAEFAKATVCEYNDPTNCKLTIKDLEYHLKSEKNPVKLAYYWTAWHDKMSAVITPEYYHELVNLLNENSNANGFRNQIETLLVLYEDGTEGWTPIGFERMLIGLAEDISGLYDILHAYVRMKLRKMPEYAGMINKCGYIPIHILGNMWGQEWSTMDKITKPYPAAPMLDSTPALQAQGYTPLKMFQEADKFFKDLGLTGMSKDFWKNSEIKRPTDGRQMMCHATAWDMCKGKGNTDFRIRQCTAVNQQDFFIVHHEMGHVEYFQQFSDLEFVFRSGANPGFDEAIGDSLTLAVSTPKHLQCKLNLDLGFPPSFCEQDKKGPFNVTETDINYLYKVALEKLAFIPFAYSVDFWRWRVYEGKIPVENYNKMWWKVRQAFQGIQTPTDRFSEKLFDPASKFHVTANVDYLRYFVSHILQFQFYEAMCIAAKEYDPKDPNSKPLYQCDFSGSKEAGKLIANMMKMGCSKEWPDALEAMTGKRKLSVAPFKHYLEPILDFMKKELQANGEIIGFGDSCKEVYKRKGASKWSLLIPKEFWTDS